MNISCYILLLVLYSPKIDAYSRSQKEGWFGDNCDVAKECWSQRCDVYKSLTCLCGTKEGNVCRQDVDCCGDNVCMFAGKKYGCCASLSRKLSIKNSRKATTVRCVDAFYKCDYDCDCCGGYCLLGQMCEL